MDIVTVLVDRGDVYEEVAKASDYTGSKLIGEDEGARDRILATDEDLAEMGRLWDEATAGANDCLKEMLVRGGTVDLGSGGGKGYEAVLEVSGGYDKELTGSVREALRGFIISYIISGWFAYTNKGEAEVYAARATEWLGMARGLLYTRRRPARPTD